MKRIIGKKMYKDQSNSDCEDVRKFKVDPINPDSVTTKNVPFRFVWVSETIDANSQQTGFIPYRWLDIGSYTGALPVLAARKCLSPNDPLNPTIRTSVDAIEPNKEVFEALDAMAKSSSDKLSITAHNIHIEDFEPDKQYSVITAFEILEHTKDPLFCIEKIYDLLEIGGFLFMTVPEESKTFGSQDHNPWHYWSSSIQSLVSVIFYDDRKWHIINIFEEGGLIHAQVKKRVYTQ